MKIHQDKSTLYSKLFNHRFITIHATGHAIIFDIRTQVVNSLENDHTIDLLDAPRVFLIPISLTRWVAINEANPKSPRQAINIASIEKITIRSLDCFSLL